MDPTLKRSMKLTGVAFVIAFALGIVGVSLSGNYRLLMWGAAAGVVFAMLIFLAGAYRRRSTVLSSPAGRPTQKIQGWAAIATAIVAGLAATIIPLVAGKATQMTFLGAAFGFVAAIALILSPLFYKPVPPQRR